MDVVGVIRTLDSQGQLPRLCPAPSVGSTARLWSEWENQALKTDRNLEGQRDRGRDRTDGETEGERERGTF